VKPEHESSQKIFHVIEAVLNSLLAGHNSPHDKELDCIVLFDGAPSDIMIPILFKRIKEINYD